MSVDELRERIKNELVLNQGNVADWQWTRTGLPAEATELGISDFLRLVEDVSRPLNAQFGKILDLEALILKVATDNRKQLSEVQIGGFALDAERLGLSRSFVIEQWVPRVLAKIPNASAATTEKPVEPSGLGTLPTNRVVEGMPAYTPSEPKPVIVADNRSGTLVETAETMQQRVRDILDDYKEYIPAPAIRALFKAINYDEKALADAVLTYLTANFYASEKEPQGNTLREKLISTDWRHLIWWDRPKPAASVPLTAQPVGPALVPASGTLVPVEKKSSGWRDLLVALLIAGGLIGFVVVLVRSNGKQTGEEREQTQTEQTDTDPTAQENGERTPPKRKKPTKKKPVVTPKSDTEATPTAPVLPREKPYDKLLGDVGQYGERPARKDGQWGLWRNRKWMILPVYDEISVYRDGRARVTVNGNSYDLDSNGDRIRE